MVPSLAPHGANWEGSLPTVGRSVRALISQANLKKQQLDVIVASTDGLVGLVRTPTTLST